MMKQEYKAKWVEALRSGDYTQTIGTLRKVDALGTVLGYCCLGVLCELVKDEVDLEPNTARSGYYGVLDDGLRIELDGTLPSVVQELVEVDSNPLVVVAGHTYQLASLNDGTGSGVGRQQLTFLEIADLIEAQL